MNIFQVFSDYTFLLVMISTSILTAIGGMIGVIMILQKQSLTGDALAHASLPGIVLAFLITKMRVTSVLLIGAFISGIIAIFIIQFVYKNSKLPFDGILALILSTFFGFGTVLLTVAQKNANSAQAGLKNFIFGQASSIIFSDVKLIIIMTIIVIILFSLFWKEIKLYTFDPLFTLTQGFSNKFIQFILSAILVVVIILGLQSVGMILMSAVLVAPGITALQWSKNYNKVMFLSAFFAFISSFLGTWISSMFGKVPTGATIVFIMSLFAISSLFIAPQGIIYKYFYDKRLKAKIEKGEYTS